MVLVEAFRMGFSVVRGVAEYSRWRSYFTFCLTPGEVIFVLIPSDSTLLYGREGPPRLSRYRVASNSLAFTDRPSTSATPAPSRCPWNRFEATSVPRNDLFTSDRLSFWILWRISRHSVYLVGGKPISLAR